MYFSLIKRKYTHLHVHVESFSKAKQTFFLSFVHSFIHSFIHSIIHSFILETYIAPLQDTTTQRHSQPSHGQRRRTRRRCKIWKGRTTFE